MSGSGSLSSKSLEELHGLLQRAQRAHPDVKRAFDSAKQSCKDETIELERLCVSLREYCDSVWAQLRDRERELARMDFEIKNEGKNHLKDVFNELLHLYKAEQEKARGESDCRA